MTPPDPSTTAPPAPPPAASRAGSPGNALLRALPPAERDRLLPHLEPIALEPMQPLARRGEALPYAWFPETGVISLLTRLDDGTLIENGTVGREGMAGVPLVLEVDWTPSEITGQVPGVALRVPVERMRALLPALPTLERLLRRYTFAFMGQVAQTLACNSVHPLRQRCARWLALTHDRVGEDTFTLTHEVLAQMLAVRRAGVTEAAGALQLAGWIRYRRGRVTIVDRAGLESGSCECYAAVRALHERVLGLPVG